VTPFAGHPARRGPTFAAGGTLIGDKKVFYAANRSAKKMASADAAAKIGI